MFLINLSGKESIYRQIKAQIEKFIDNGILKPGDKLPSVRALADELGINPNTVMKAYTELENNGYIYTVSKKGVFVTQDIQQVKREQKQDAVRMLSLLKDEGFTKEEIVILLEDVFKEDDNA